MSRKDAGTAPKNGRRWAIRISVLVLFVCVVGAAIAIRCIWRQGAATAADPVSRPASHTQQQAATAGTTAPPPNTMAIVNGETITRQQLAQNTLMRYGKKVLEGLINKHLILQACNASGIVITHKDIDAEIEKIAQKFGLSMDRWLQLLATERHVNSQQYRRDVIWPTLALRRLAADSLTVSQEEMQKSWEIEFGAKVQVRMIALRTREEAEQVRAQALSGADFGKLAKDKSTDRNSAAVRGVIPPVRRHVGDPEIERVVFGLRDGEISEVVQAVNQFFIFQCERRFPPMHPAAAQVRAEQIRIRDKILEGKLRQAASELFKRLQDDAKDQIVNVYNDPRLRQQYPGVAAIINGRQVTVRELAEECIARHGLDVLETEINRFLLLQALRRRNQTVAEADLDAEIARAAESFGYLKSGKPDIESWMAEVTQQEDVTVDIYIQDAVWPSAALKKLVRSGIKVTEEDKIKGFEANFGERVEAMAIILGSHRRANEVYKLATGNPTKTYFGDLAHEYSIEPVSRANFGQVPPIQRHGGQPLLEDWAFRLSPGEISGLISVGDKFIILRCLGRTKPIVTQRADVEEELERDIYEKKLRIAMADAFEHLKMTATIDNFLAGTRQTGKQREGVQTASHAAP